MKKSYEGGRKRGGEGSRRRKSIKIWVEEGKEEKVKGRKK